ncbi:unnamed protein product, partial [Iphiclides podalirius]
MITETDNHRRLKTDGSPSRNPDVARRRWRSVVEGQFALRLRYRACATLLRASLSLPRLPAAVPLSPGRVDIYDARYAYGVLHTSTQFPGVPSKRQSRSVVRSRGTSRPQQCRAPCC